MAAAKMLDKRGVRRMLVTTLGRIERCERTIREYSDDSLWTDCEWSTPAKRAVAVQESRERLAKEQANLRRYNEMAAKIIAEQRA